MTFQTLLTHPAVQSLGWALLHFIWQGAVLAALFLAANTLTRRFQASLRYAIGCVVMLLMPIVFITTILRANLAAGQPNPVQFAPVVVSGSATEPIPLANSAVLPTSTAGVPTSPAANMIPGWIVCLWLAGIVALSIYTIIGWLRVQRLRRRGTEPADPAWIEAMQDLTRHLQISRPVRLCLSAVAEVPTVIGWMRPYILLPISAVTGLDEAQLRAILAHELAHIRRYDYLVNLLQNAIETLLFYHPAVWWVSRQIRQEREHCCDDLAVEVCGDVMVYAGALAQLEEMRGSVSEPALAATGGDLLARIRRLLGRGHEKGPDRIAGSLGAISTAALIVAVLTGVGNAPPIHAKSLRDVQAFQLPTAPAPVLPIQLEPKPVLMAQAQAPPVPAAVPSTPAAPAPKFDAVSIRPCSSGDTSGRGRGGGVPGNGPAPGLGGYFGRSPGRLNISCGSLMSMIDIAYVSNGTEPLINDSGGPLSTVTRIRGLPAWAISARYTIEAVTDDPVANGPTDGGSPAWKLMIGPMLQALLADRFQVKFHREAEEVPMYALTIAKSGLKLKPMQDGDCVVIEKNAPAPPLHFPGPNEKPYCHSFMTGRNGPTDPNWVMVAGGQTLAGLARALSNTVDRHVIDQTGNSETYNLRLEFAHDETTPGGLPPDVGEPPSAVTPGPSVFTALEQLGLKLEPIRGPRGYIVVDSVSPPSEN